MMALQMKIFTFSVCAFVGACTCHGTYVEVRGQPSGIDSLPFYQWDSGLELGSEVFIAHTDLFLQATSQSSWPLLYSSLILIRKR